MQPAKSQTSLRIRAVWSEPLLLTELNLEFLSLKGGSSVSIHVRMSHCWKSHVKAHMWNHRLCLYDGTHTYVDCVLPTYFFSLLLLMGESFRIIPEFRILRLTFYWKCGFAYSVDSFCGISSGTASEEACFAPATPVWLAVNYNTSVTSGEWIPCFKQIAQASELSVKFCVVHWAMNGCKN